MRSSRDEEVRHTVPPVALLTPHIAEAGIGKDVPLIFASDMKTFKFATRARSHRMSRAKCFD